MVLFVLLDVLLYGGNFELIGDRVDFLGKWVGVVGYSFFRFLSFSDEGVY